MWRKLGRFYVGEHLVFTPLFKEQLVRVIQSRPIYPDKVKGFIYQGFRDRTGVNIFDRREITYTKEPKIFTFSLPPELEERSLVFTRTDKSKILWFVDVEVYESDTAIDEQNCNQLNEEQLANYLADYLMPKLNNMKLDLIPKSESIPIKKGFDAQILVNSNPNRAYLSIRADRSPVYVWSDNFIEVDGRQQPITILAEIDKGDTWNLPVLADGIYKGAIYVQVTKNSDVDYTEYSYPQETTS